MPVIPFWKTNKTKTVPFYKQTQMTTYMSILKYGRLPAGWLYRSGRKGKKKEQAQKKKIKKIVYKNKCIICTMKIYDN